MQQSGTTEVCILIENLYKFKVFEDKKSIREFSNEGKNFKS